MLVLLAAGVAHALSTDRDQPIYIDADWVRVNDKTGLSEYQGNVKLKQGSMVITADNMTVHQSGGELQTIMINGKPATFSQRRDGEDQPVQAEASQMEYHAGKKRIYLIGDA
ncbi:MAG: lipopolysaccharide transport periplasmic protein LptA, partial [Pseudomonadota bacterium]